MFVSERIKCIELNNGFVSYDFKMRRRYEGHFVVRFSFFWIQTYFFQNSFALGRCETRFSRLSFLFYVLSFIHRRESKSVADHPNPVEVARVRASVAPPSRMNSLWYIYIDRLLLDRSIGYSVSILNPNRILRIKSH
jgi:hypothetical protein